MASLSEKFLNTIEFGNSVHGYLLVSPDTERSFELAQTAAALLLFGNRAIEPLKLHPDYFELDGSIKIDELRSVRNELYKQTYAGKNRAVIIKNVHIMNDNAVNAMLKMLEEPPDGTYFLLTGVEQRVLPTIRSRCHIVRIGSNDHENIIKQLTSIGASSADASRIEKMAFGDEKRAIRLYNDEAYRDLRKNAISAMLELLDGKSPFKWAKSLAKDRDNAVSCIEFMLGVCHDMNRLLSGLDIESNPDYSFEINKRIKGFTFSQIGIIIDLLVETLMKLTTNANVGLALDSLIVKLNSEIIPRSN